MTKAMKILVYRFCKGIGLFRLSRRWAARRLRIICYHGISVRDEHLFEPALFMRPETVRSRMELIRRGGYAVLPLAEAVEQMYAGTLPSDTVVITFDDGLYMSTVHGTAIVRELRLPLTFYVTTYYVAKQTPIFRLLVRYMFWKTDRHELLLDNLPGLEAGAVPTKGGQADGPMWRLIRHAEEQLDEPGRVALGRELGARLGLDYDALSRDRQLSLVSTEEIARMADAGVDVQLHTHRHRMPVDERELSREIRDNRAILEPIVGHPCDHLCYPSGAFTTELWPWLEAERVASATTCIVGLNDARTPPYALKRFLDSEGTTRIEFEAELSGFAEVLRRVHAAFRGEETPTSCPMAYGH